MGATPFEEGRKQVYVQHMKNLVKELIQKDDTQLLWFDGEEVVPKESVKILLKVGKMLRKE